MEGGAYMCLVFCGLVCTAQGVTLTRTTKFMGGDVLFLWTGTSPEYDVMITRDNKVDRWVRVTDTQYTVKDALLYDSIGINVRSPRDPTDIKMDCTVTKVDSNVGESVNISWTAPFFPRAGRYNIYHTDKVNRSIIQVTSGGVNLDQTKYEYHSRPYDSTNIMFEIRDITLDDAGYYNGGINEEAAWNGGGVVLIVHDKISKPQIQGNLNISVGNSSELTCSPKSSSAPDYYARLFPLSYSLFVNNTELTGETRETLSFPVSKEHKYNQYSCSARDKQQISDRSDSVRINCLYLDGPQLFINESRVPYSNQAVVQANEKTSFRLSCNVNGNPNPSIGLSRDANTGNIDEGRNTEWLNYTINSLGCSDTDTYTCIGKSTEFSDKMKSIQVNVKCDTRFDTSVIFKSNYGSTSGSDVDVIVAVPVIANPSPQGSDFTWSGPTGNMNINSIISQQNVIYKHLVKSSIPIPDQQYFGNYTLMYKGRSITTVIIFALDIPKPPVNFTSYYYAPGLLNLTWVSGFNGRSEQFFILSTNKGSVWEEVANISDPGEGRIGYFNTGPLVPGQTYWYRLNSCNRINCSVQSVDVSVTVVKELKLVNENERPCLAFYGLLVPFLLILLCNVWCIIREIRRKFQHHRRKQNKENENSCPNTTQDQGHVYDDLKANSAYQELGEVSKPSIYDKLK